MSELWSAVTGRAPLVRRLSGGMLDVGLASLGSFAVGVYAARFLDPAALGAFALFFALFTTLTVFPSEGIFVPAEAAAVSRPEQDRRHLAGQAVPVGFAAALLVAPGVLIAVWLLSDSVPASVTTPLAITTALTVMVAPLQEHVRRVCHLAGLSWRASVVSAVQLAAIVASLVGMALAGIDPAWIPFGALAVANVLSLAVGVALLAHGRGGALGIRLRPASLVRAGRWLVTAAAARAGSAVVAAALIEQLASVEVLGYAEAARVIGRPVLVVAIGLQAVLGPRSVEAGLNLDRRRARRISGGFLAILAGIAVPYLAVVGWVWTGNPVAVLIPAAYVVAWLVPAQILADFLGGIVFPYRMELIGAGREAALLPAELVGGGAQIAIGATAAATGGFARPLGLLALRLTQFVRYRRSLDAIYRHGAGVIS